MNGGRHNSRNGIGRATRQIAAVMVGLLLALPALAMPPDKPNAPEPPVGPLPNIALQTLGGAQFWSDELVYRDWRVQQNLLTGHYRLLDDRDFRRAWGTFEQCRDRLDEIKREQGWQEMQGKVVITLHGLGRPRSVMNDVGSAVQKAGYTWVNVSYASTHGSLDEHAAGLAKIIDHLPQVEEINFVGHSLGNLVVRRYLGERDQPIPHWQVDSRIRRIVMLAPPNNGAHLAELFKNNKLFGLLVGPSGKQLAADWPAVEKRLATPRCEFGIIAGQATLFGPHPFLAGDNDLVVAVEETRLPGARDFLLLQRHHGAFLHDAQVQQHVVRFLQEGYFVSAAARQPIVRMEQAQHERSGDALGMPP